MVHAGKEEGRLDKGGARVQNASFVFRFWNHCEVKSSFTRRDTPALYYRSHPNSSDNDGLEGRTLTVGGIINSY